MYLLKLGGPGGLPGAQDRGQTHLDQDVGGQVHLQFLGRSFAGVGCGVKVDLLAGNCCACT